MIVLASGLASSALAELAEDFEGKFQTVWVVACEDRQDWGHEKRAQGLARASKEWVGFFNDDDSYALTYLEKMLGAAGSDDDVAWCGWNVINRPSFSLGNSTSGNYIVRTELARKVGYQDRHYEADGTFINAIRDNARGLVFVDEVLYAHNFQP